MRERSAKTRRGEPPVGERGLHLDSHPLFFPASDRAFSQAAVEGSSQLSFGSETVRCTSARRLIAVSAVAAIPVCELSDRTQRVEKEMWDLGPERFEPGSRQQPLSSPRPIDVDDGWADANRGDEGRARDPERGRQSRLS